MSIENVGLMCSRSLSQLRLNVSVNVSLDDIVYIAESFVTKASMVRHHYKRRNSVADPWLVNLLSRHCAAVFLVDVVHL